MGLAGGGPGLAGGRNGHPESGYHPLCRLESALSDHRGRRIGLELGADYAIDPQSAPIADQIEAAIRTRGTDVVIECVGNTAATAQAFEAAKDGATVLLFSVPKAGSHYFQKELKIVGSRINPDTHGRAAALINSGKVVVDKLFTHSYPIERLEDAIIKQTENDSIKVLIEPEVPHELF